MSLCLGFIVSPEGCRVTTCHRHTGRPIHSTQGHILQVYTASTLYVCVCMRLSVCGLLVGAPSRASMSACICLLTEVTISCPQSVHCVSAPFSVDTLPCPSPWQRRRVCVCVRSVCACVLSPPGHFREHARAALPFTTFYVECQK